MQKEEERQDFIVVNVFANLRILRVIALNNIKIMFTIIAFKCQHEVNYDLKIIDNLKIEYG